MTVLVVDVRDEEDWSDRPTRGAGDGVVRLQLQQKLVRQALIRVSFVAQSLNSDFFDVSIRYIIIANKLANIEFHVIMTYIIITCGAE